MNFSEKEKLILAAAVNKWGFGIQFVVAIEEMAELTQALSKYIRGPVPRAPGGMDDELDDAGEHALIAKVAEEVADVEIMLEQVKITLNLSADSEGFRNIKMKRLEERLRNAP